MADDKINIGLSQEANQVADKLEQTGFFEDRLTIAKFALAYAIQNGLDSDYQNIKIGETSGTKWNIGSVDSDHYLRDLLASLYPNVSTPYRLVEILMNVGLVGIGNIYGNGNIYKISDLLKNDQSKESMDHC